MTGRPESSQPEVQVAGRKCGKLSAVNTYPFLSVWSDWAHKVKFLPLRMIKNVRFWDENKPGADKNKDEGTWSMAAAGAASIRR